MAQFNVSLVQLSNEGFEHTHYRHRSVFTRLFNNGGHNNCKTKIPNTKALHYWQWRQVYHCLSPCNSEPWWQKKFKRGPYKTKGNIKGKRKPITWHNLEALEKLDATVYKNKLLENKEEYLASCWDIPSNRFHIRFCTTLFSGFIESDFNNFPQFVKQEYFSGNIYANIDPASPIYHPTKESRVSGGGDKNYVLQDNGYFYKYPVNTISTNPIINIPTSTSNIPTSPSNTSQPTSTSQSSNTINTSQINPQPSTLSNSTNPTSLHSNISTSQSNFSTSSTNTKSQTSQSSASSI